MLQHQVENKSNAAQPAGTVLPWQKKTASYHSRMTKCNLSKNDVLVYVFGADPQKTLWVMPTKYVITCLISCMFIKVFAACLCMSVRERKGMDVCESPSPVPPACLLSGCLVASPLCCWCAGWTNCEPCASAWGDGQPRQSRCCFRPPQASLLPRGWPCPLLTSYLRGR